MNSEWSKAERYAYGKGIDKGRREAETARAETADLWAKLGVQSQKQAVAAIDHINFKLAEGERRGDDFLLKIRELCATVDGMKEQFDAMSDIAVSRQNKIGELQRKYDDRCAELILADNKANKDREAWGYERIELMRRIDGLSSQLRASRSMSEHYRKDRDKLDDMVTELKGNLEGAKRLLKDLSDLTPPKPVVISANLGLATTGQLLDELKSRASIGGYADYCTADPAPETFGARSTRITRSVLIPDEEEKK